MGHEWHHNTPIGTDDAANMTDNPKTPFRAPFGGSYGMVGIPSVCKQCGTERMRWISRSGEMIVRYMHPDGYAQHGEERLSTTQWRVTYVSTIFDTFEIPAPRRQRATR